MRSWPIGLYGAGMHDFILRGIEIGTRAATIEDSEWCGWSALDDLRYSEFANRQGANHDRNS